MDLLMDCKDIYNCIAELAEFVYNTANNLDYVTFISTEITLSKSYFCLDMVLEKKLNGILYDIGGTIVLTEDNYLKVSEIVQSATRELLDKKCLQKIFIFLQLLDKVLLKNIINESWKEELGEVQYLNSNEKETGIGILPYYHCGWDLSSERINRSHDINVFVDNYLIVNLNKFNGMKLNHFYLDSQTKLNKSKLKVGISPLWKWFNFEANKVEENSKKVINIKYNSDSKKENDIICKTIDKAAEEKVDILLFPEMLGNYNMKNVIRKKLLKSRCDFPKIIVLPSFWNNGSNTARVVDKYGIEIFEQVKRTPYIDNDHYCENLKTQNEINIMHIRGFGRILIMICRDFLEVRDLELILNELRPTVILVPSFSTGYHDFERVKGICEAHECVVIWVNSCAGGRPENPIGFIDKAGHSYNPEKDRLSVFHSCEKRSIACSECCENICLYTDTLINPKAVEGVN